MKKGFIFLFLIIFPSAAHAKYIIFEFTHSLRIPYHKVKVEIIPHANQYLVKASAEPKNRSEKWDHTKKKIQRNISKQEFDKIYQYLNELNTQYLMTQNGRIGFDGSTWKLKWGDLMNHIQIQLWSPDHNKQNGKFRNFIKSFEMVLKTSGFPIQEILNDRPEM